MFKLFIATILLCLTTVAAHAQSPGSDDMSELRRPRPGPGATVYRCCAKPNYGTMYCRESSDRLLAWDAAIDACERQYGSGNCVSGCRRLMRNELSVDIDE